MWKTDNLHPKNRTKTDIFMHFFSEYSTVGKAGFTNIVSWVLDPA